jgi:hypothetical protein
MNKNERLAAAKLVHDAPDFEAEQSAIARAAVVDVLPSLPEGAADLHHQWDDRRETETTRDYVAVCKKIGAAFDRGARRYVISAKKAVAARDALSAEGFVVALHRSLA